MPSASSAREASEEQPGGPWRVLTPAFAMGAVAIVLQMATNGRYGYFRDELYFIDLSKHLAAGYVDLAPLAAWILAVSRAVFGESLHALRLLPALANGAEIIVAGLITRELGGRRFAVLLAAVSVLVAPVILAGATRYSMNAFEPLFWMGAVYFLLRAVHLERPQLLLWCGVLIGFGLENKHSTAFFLIALVAGLIASPEGRLLRTKWFWIAAAIVAVIALPNIIWQVQHQFPTWVDLRNVQRTHKNVQLPPLAFLKQQIFVLNPFSALVWVPGLAWLLAGKVRGARALGATYVAFFAMMMALHAKDYYAAPIYPMLFAAGGVFWEHTLSRVPGGREAWWKTAVQVGLPLLVLMGGVLAVPLVVPILPAAKVPAYAARLGVAPPRAEVKHSGPLPQHFGDEFGWPEMVAAVARFYNALPAEERSKTAILAGNYGEAGAIDFFGPAYGLPPAISAHQNLWYWGPRQYTGESVILLQWDRDSADAFCNSVQEGPKLDPQWAMEEEHFTIWLCRGFKKPLPQLWNRLKHWN